MTGRRVVTLVSGRLEAGHHELSWLGRDQNGHQVASGLYVSRLESGGEVLTRKMLLLK
jgi:flagellar hook assembly protein FlgD